MTTDHLHDRSIPDGTTDVEQETGSDGLLICPDCEEPSYYCETFEDYFHIDESAFCFLKQKNHAGIVRRTPWHR